MIPAKLNRWGPDLARMALIINIYSLLPSAGQIATAFPADLYAPHLLTLPFAELPWTLATHVLLLKIALLPVLLGWGGRWTPALAFVLSLPALGWKYDFGFFHWSDAVLSTSLLAFALVPYDRSRPEELRWHLAAMRLLLIFPFFSAGVAKLRFTGWGWGKTENISAIFDYNEALFGDWLAHRSAYATLRNSGAWLSMAAYGVLAIELTSPLAFWRRARVVVIPLLFSVHVSFAYLFGHDFLRFYWPLYIYWIPWKSDS